MRNAPINVVIENLDGPRLDLAGRLFRDGY